MTTLFIADLHLEESRPDITELFFKFLRQQASQANALYILGDLFEVWIGDDDHTPFNQSIIQVLRQIRDNGTRIYLMRGNRDFLINKKFLGQSGCILLPDEHVILLAGQPTLLMHGDTLCTQDIQYLKFRRKSRNFFVQKLFLLKSLSARRAIAQQARQISYDHTHSIAPQIMDVTPEEVTRMMIKHQVHHLIHGHTHRPAMHHFLVNGKIATRIVLAPWHEHGSALIYHDNGLQEFIEIK